MSDISANTKESKSKPRRLRPLHWATLKRYFRLNSRTTRLGLILLVAAIISGFATYGALTATPPFGNDPKTVIWLLNIDLIILLFLLILVARRIVSVWTGRRRGKAGSRLHARLVFIFSLLAAAPAIIMTVFAAFFLHFGVQSWFSDQVFTAVHESQAVAEAYLEEHKQIIRADTLAMANDLERQASLLVTNPKAFQKIMQTQLLLRNLSEAVIFDKSGRIIAEAGLTFTLALETMPNPALARAEAGEVIVMTGGSDDRVRALVQLDNLIDGYLFVGRMVDPVVLSNVKDTRQAVKKYNQLETQRSSLEIKITMIFVVVALFLVLAAIWFGLVFSRQLVNPISALIAAADRVRAGDLTVRVEKFNRKDEFDVLAGTFNRMTSQIQQQQAELIAANRQVDERRRFIETVLAGVSAGIIGIDSEGDITLANASAADLFDQAEDDLTKQNIASIVPGIKPLLEQAESKPSRITQAEIPYERKDGTTRTLLVRIVVDVIGGEEKGAVLTFDDITELQSAQRKAAWADVARRIAHEIKNPLTPIQLSAERLKRKYISQIQTDQDIFSQCTDTIIHHVDDIGRMVNEFSTFARMPEAVLKEENIVRHIREMVVLQQQAHPDVDIELNADFARYDIEVDAQKIRQAFTNIIQNALDSLDGQSPDKKILITLTESVFKGDECLKIEVMDSGVGLPDDVDPTRLTEPYVTKKERGTGLGLAIVKKIMEDHHGWLQVRRIDDKSLIYATAVSLVLPVHKSQSIDSGTVERQSAIT